MVDRFVTWAHRYPWGNALEHLAVQALEDLDYEQCCGEPSHGGPGATIGAVFEGTDLAILGVPIEHSELTGIEPTERVTFGPGEAIVFDSDAGHTVGFFCGDTTWTISWTILNPPPADVEKMVRLGEALLPHLACTLRAPLQR